jgi:hypothetical protein
MRALLAAVMLAFVAPLAATELRVVDSVTGAPLAARALVDDAPGRIIALDVHGSRLPPDLEDASVEIRADGHAPLRTRVAAPTSGRLTVQLDPLHVPAYIAATLERARAEPHLEILHGHVRTSDGDAIASALVTTDDGRVARTDADGYFVLARTTDERPGVVAVRVEASGHAPLVRTQIARVPGATHLLLLPDRTIARRERAEYGAYDRADAPADAVGVADAASTPLPALNPLTPPASIRVGFGDAGCTTTCCGTSCPNVCTMSLETYVKRGLDSEWIASWNTQSLRAGSVAYRSYGARHVLHPRTPTYDICSSACCQVNDAQTHSSTDAAAARTPGLMLTRDASEPYRAEYSAENNSWDDPADGLSCSNVDLSCGDGQAGSPSASWPCLADPVGAGHGCFGHGRGMSQWGTQRWAIAATAQRWKWIVNHYYHDNGNESGAGTGQRTALMTTPVSILSADIGAVAVPGQLLTIDISAQNLAGASHDHVMIGASLYRAGVGYVSDPAHDAAITLPVGTSPRNRLFAVPAIVTAGAYDLVVALYLDVDENGAISSDDLALHALTQPQAVTLVDDRVFADGFE